MQTFLPLEDFAASAKVLDSVRLWKQCLESVQLINGRKGWRNHPASRMWEQKIEWLHYYSGTMFLEFRNRGGHLRTMSMPDYWRTIIRPTTLPPWWLGYEDLHRSHRSNLLRKDPIFYGRYNWTEPRDLEYFWPCP